MQIEFTSIPSRTFLVTVRNPASNYAAVATGIACTEVSPGRYRSNVGSLTGLVWIEAIAGATRSLGFADLNSPAANGYAHVVDALVAVDVAAIAAAVTEAGVTLTNDNVAAIALAVYRRLASGSAAAVARVAGPTIGEPVDAINSADFDYSASIETTSTSTLVFSIRKCADDPTPQLEADSVGGLTILTGQATPTSSQAVITRVSATQATVLVKAAAFVSLAPGEYHSELRELTTDGKTISKLELPIVVRRSASRRSA